MSATTWISLPDPEVLCWIATPCPVRASGVLWWPVFESPLTIAEDAGYCGA